MCPIVPMFTCGFDRSNFSFAIAHYPRYPLFNSFKSLFLERGTGFEPATIALEERDSTVALPPPRTLRGPPLCPTSFDSPALRPTRTWSLRPAPGAADLQPAGLTHPPPRPPNSPGTQTSRPANLPGQRTHALRTPPPAHTALPPAGRSEGTQVKAKNGLVPKDTSPSL